MRDAWDFQEDYFRTKYGHKEPDQGAAATTHTTATSSVPTCPKAQAPATARSKRASAVSAPVRSKVKTSAPMPARSKPESLASMPEWPKRAASTPVASGCKEEAEPMQSAEKASKSNEANDPDLQSDVDIVEMDSVDVQVIYPIGEWRWRSEEQWLVHTSWLGSQGEPIALRNIPQQGFSPKWLNRKQMEETLGDTNVIRFLAKSMDADLKRLQIPEQLPYGLQIIGPTLDLVWFMLRLQLSIPWKDCKKSFEGKARRWTERLMHLSKADTPSEEKLTDDQILSKLLMELGNNIKESSFHDDFDFKSWQAELKEIALQELSGNHDEELRDCQMTTRKLSGFLHTAEPSAPSLHFTSALMGLAKRLASAIRWEE